MIHFISRRGLWIAGSAVLSVFALGLAWFLLAWICLVPFFMAIQDYKEKKAFYAGGLFGFIYGSMTLYWLLRAVASLSDGGTGKGILTGLIVFGILAIYYGLLLLCFSALKIKGRLPALNAVLMAAIWTTGEYLLSLVFPGMPWFSISIGNALLGNLYTVQPAEFGGIHLLNFFVVLVNYLLAHYLLRRQWQKILVPVGLVALYTAAGSGILYCFRQHMDVSGKPVSVAVLSGNIPDDLKWDETNGDALAKSLLALNQEALHTRPDIVLWPESTVPWTYTPDDDFIKAVLKENKVLSPATSHIIGIGTSLSTNTMYNSAYYLLPDGSIGGRHDKHYLVRMAEEPFTLPFLKPDEAHVSCKSGKEGTVAGKREARAGILICSEVFVTGAARAAVKNGAAFLVSLSNDALFGAASGAVYQQFLRNRLRAVEVRKDIAVTCNMGISGMINAAGAVVLAGWQETGFTKTVVIQPNNYKPMSSVWGIVVVWFSFAIILAFPFLKRYIRGFS
jgi:apolipoprotein N-acyltransferase